MKNIENKKVKVQGSEILYSDLILQCIVTPPSNNEGLKYIDFKFIDKITPLLTGEAIYLEDAFFEFVKSKVLDMRWTIFDKELYYFAEYIEALK